MTTEQYNKVIDAILTIKEVFSEETEIHKEAEALENKIIDSQIPF